MSTSYRYIKRKAFTLLEMIIVLVVLGIMANFAVEILVNTYENYILTSTQNRIQSQSESAVTQIANRLEYRIKDSVIAKRADGTYQALSSAGNSNLDVILEWVSIDREGWLGNTNVPLWSGFINVDSTTGPTVLISPQTNLTLLNTLISNLSPRGATVDDSAIHFTGGSGDSGLDGFGWSAGSLTTQTEFMHPIQRSGNNFQSSIAGVNFSGADIYEFYKFSWTAYAIEKQSNGDLFLYYDYRPWNNETYTNGRAQLLMENVTTFAFKSEGGVISLQVCVSDNDLLGEGAYSICKEKTVF